MNLTKSYLDQLTYKINGACIEVHRLLGPGLLESVYHQCLKRELHLRDIRFISEMHIPIHYKGVDVAADFRCDLLIEDAIVLELKAVETVQPIHVAKLITYMKLAEKPKGILVNFNVVHLMTLGHETYVNEMFRNLPE